MFDRNQLKASYKMSSEVQGTLVEDIGMQVYTVLSLTVVKEN